MKTFIALALFAASVSIHAQVGTSPRTLTRRIEPQLRPQPPSARPAAGGAVAGVAASKAPLTAAEMEQKQIEQSIEDKKKLQWQMERAEKGSDAAQLTLGMRYLKGEGVEKDLKKAKKWLSESAKNGNAEAKKKLSETPELAAIKLDEAPAPAAKP